MASWTSHIRQTFQAFLLSGAHQRSFPLFIVCSFRQYLFYILRDFLCGPKQQIFIAMYSRIWDLQQKHFAKYIRNSWACLKSAPFLQCSLNMYQVKASDSKATVHPRTNRSGQMWWGGLTGITYRLVYKAILESPPARAGWVPGNFINSGMDFADQDWLCFCILWLGVCYRYLFNLL